MKKIVETTYRAAYLEATWNVYGGKITITQDEDGFVATIKTADGWSMSRTHPTSGDAALERLDTDAMFGMLV